MNLNCSGTDQTTRVNLLFLADEKYKFDLHHLTVLHYAAQQCREEFRSDWLHVDNVEQSAAPKKQFDSSAAPNGMTCDILVCKI